MVKTGEAIRTARALIGTPYDKLDCINLIKKVIRTASGGNKNYTTADIEAGTEYIVCAQKGLRMRTKPDIHG